MDHRLRGISETFEACGFVKSCLPSGHAFHSNRKNDEYVHHRATFELFLGHLITFKANSEKNPILRTGMPPESPDTITYLEY